MEYWYWIVLALGVNITGFPPGLSATQFLATSDPSLAAVCSPLSLSCSYGHSPGVCVVLERPTEPRRMHPRARQYHGTPSALPAHIRSEVSGTLTLA